MQFTPTATPASPEAGAAKRPDSSRSRVFKTALFTGLVIASSVAGNAFLSYGMRHIDPSGAPLPEFFLPFTSPMVWVGITLLIVWMLSRMTLLTWADLSFVVPVTSLGYVLNVAAGALVLGEAVDSKRWVGALLIVAGSILTGLTIRDQTNVHRAGQAPRDEPERAL